MAALDELNKTIAELTSRGQPYELETVEIQGQIYRNYANQPKNLREYFDKTAEFGDRTMIVHGNHRFSFTTMQKNAISFGAAITERFQIKRGDRVAIAMRNNAEWMMAFTGITIAGAIAVPLNAWWTTEELEYAISDCGAKVVLVDPDRAKSVQPFARRTQLSLVSVGDCGSIDYPTQDMHSLLSEYIDHSLPNIDIDPDDDAFILYTSGSTGLPKGAISTHRAVISAIYSWVLNGHAYKLSRRRMETSNTTSEASLPPCILLNVPLFHSAGMHSSFLLSAMIGRKIVIMDKWCPEKALELIEAEKVTNFMGVPTMSAELQAAAKASTRDLSSLKEIYSGGAARPPEQVKRLSRTFKSSSPGSGYGLTETNAIGAINTGDLYLERPASTGYITPAVTDLNIVDPDTKEVLNSGEQGEIRIRSTTNARGYWNNAQATEKAFVDGWFYTGDLGYLDNDGFLFIVDRLKDLIIRGGENISCIEVESAIDRHHSVDEVSVFGLPDERLGETVGAAIVLGNGKSLSHDELTSFLSNLIASFKIPRHVWFRREKLPRTASGKIYKRKIIDIYREEMANNLL